MKTNKNSAIVFLLMLAFLAGCGNTADTPSPAPVSSQTPSPTEDVAFSAQDPDTSAAPGSTAGAAGSLGEDQNGADDAGPEDEESLSGNAVSENSVSENVHVRVIPENFTPELMSFGPIETMSDVKELDISNINVSDIDMDTMIDSLPYLERLTMIHCGLDNDGYAQLQDRHPETRIIWEIVTYNRQWRIRTDAVAFSTFKNTGEQFVFLSRDAYYLRYCTDLVALDLGHNYVSDLSFLRYLPNLKILILVDNWRFLDDGGETRINDISDIQYCTHLRYLEIFCNKIEDISAIANLTELEDLNISYNPISSSEALRNLPNLKRLWMERTDIPYEEFEELQALYPDVEMVYYGQGSVDQGWRSGERYNAMRRMVRNNIVDPIYADPSEEDASGEETSDETAPSAGTAPAAATPETASPAGTTPENTAPENTVPENTVPESTVPENAVPDTAVPVPDPAIPGTDTTSAEPAAEVTP